MALNGQALQQIQVENVIGKTFLKQQKFKISNSE